MKMFRLLAWLLAWIAAILCSAWAFGAIYYDFPAVRQMAAGIFVLILLVAVIFVSRKTAETGGCLRPCPPVVVHAEAGQ